MHKALDEGCGSSGCWLRLSHEVKEPTKELYRLADNLAIHYFGIKSDHFYEDQIDKSLHKTELDKCLNELGPMLKGKPDDLRDKIIKGKFMKFLETKAMEHQIVGFEESDFTIGEHMAHMEKKLGSKLRIIASERFGL